MGARLSVTRELLRAATDVALGPARVLAYARARPRLAEELALDLGHPAEVEDTALDDAARARLRERPLRVFVSCAEASGELHAVGLVRALAAELEALGAPPPVLHGLGGERLAAAGVTIVGDPVARAAMGADVLGALPFYLRLLTDAARALAATAPDVVVPVDSPALHVPLGHVARRRGLRVVHFVTPQYWGWAPWRVSGYRRAVDRALTILPFEPAWFARAGVPTTHVGHPIQDALAGVPPTRPPAALPAGTNPVLALLPGSREGVVGRNLPWMIAAAGRARLLLPALEVVLPHDRPELAAQLGEGLRRSGADDWVRLVPGKLHATLARAHAALSVSGTVLLDLLHHRLPTVVVYRVRSAAAARLRTRALTVPWFSSPNLLAGREVLPEHAFAGEGPLEAVASELVRALSDPDWRARTIAGLDEAHRRLGPPGATRRAARAVLAAAGAPRGPALPRGPGGPE